MNIREWSEWEIRPSGSFNLLQQDHRRTVYISGRGVNRGKMDVAKLLGHPVLTYIGIIDSLYLIEPAGILTCLHTCTGQRSSLGKFFFAQRLIIVICKNRIVSCYTFTKKHTHTNAQLHRGPPGQTGTVLSFSICRPGPGEICKLPDESTAPPTGPTDRPNEATIVKDLLNQQPRPITVHHINARNWGGINSS